MDPAVQSSRPTEEPDEIRAVNARTFEHFDTGGVTIHRSDEAHMSWFLEPAPMQG